VGAAEPPGVGDSHSEDETPRPPDFVPHVMRIAHLMDQKVLSVKFLDGIVDMGQLFALFYVIKIFIHI